MTSPSETQTCKHERLDSRGRCVECGEWAVLTGQVPIDPVLGKAQNLIHGSVSGNDAGSD